MKCKLNSDLNDMHAIVVHKFKLVEHNYRPSVFRFHKIVSISDIYQFHFTTRILKFYC